MKYNIDNEEDKLLIDNYLKQYNNCLHVIFNFINDSEEIEPSLKSNTKSDSLVQHKLNSLNNCDLITTHYWLRTSLISDACSRINAVEARKKLDAEKLKSYKEDIEELKEKLSKAKSIKTRKRHINKINKLNKKIDIINKKDYKTIFGGKKSFLDRCKNNITHDEFIENRYSPLSSLGDKEHTNRLFVLNDDLTGVVFKPNKGLHINLNFVSNYAYRNQLKSLLYCQQLKETAITFGFDKEYIYISYDSGNLNKKKYINRKIIKNRIMSIDLNPNYIGWTITDWKGENKFDLIKSGVISIKDLNDKHFKLKNKHVPSTDKRRIDINNKREHEVFEIAKSLIDKCLYYKCERFAYEELKINSDDKNRGKKFNSLCNNLWNRNKLINNIIKRCDIFNIKHDEVMPQYSSFVGNFLFRSLEIPDM